MAYTLCKDRAVPSGGGGGGAGGTVAPFPPPEIWQSDYKYNALKSVISAPPVIKENISALPPAQKWLGTALKDYSHGNYS